jgi:hypothetical protein
MIGKDRTKLGGFTKINVRRLKYGRISHIRALFISALFICILSTLSVPLDADAATQRSPAARAEFQRLNP